MPKHNSIDYDAILRKALRQVIREILVNAANYGISGEHHFLITFATNHPWVELPDYLKEEYPDEMMIVIQHEYWDLEVTADGFSVTLCFDEVNERIKVPFSALIEFADPSSKFGLQFVNYDNFEEDVCDETQNVKDGYPRTNVLSLDDFRKSKKRGDDD
ncbi:MAG: ClpXP protease specificity-enhancing factor SspB [Holosporales bacterium]|jgi:hypothetical protein|nr:ClpXP protease specificity-enhancing factor SspB [Holosporales bacterium]